MICCKVITPLALFPLAGLFVAVVTKVSNLTALSFTIFKSEILEVVPMLISLDEPPIVLKLCLLNLFQVH
jgi:hypothetical protein